MNPIFQQFGQRNDFFQRFAQFQKSFNGDPQQIVNQMLKSGRITQAQLNAAMQKTNELMKFMK